MTKRIPDRLQATFDPLLFPVTERHSSTIYAFRVRLEQLRTRYARVTGQPFLLESLGADGPSERYRLVADESADPGELSLQGLTQFLTHSPAAIEQLTETINSLLDQLHATETALWRREAELAAGVPVSQRPDEASHLADRLTSILRSAADLTEGVAAGLYMLDEATTELKLRAAWGLPADRLLDSARPLRGATADLEALVGHAVLLKDAALVPDWKIPEPYPAAVCVPVSSATTPLGTLWIFCDSPREFSHQQVQLLEMIAGRIAVELEREMLWQEGLQAREMCRELQEASCRQHERLPAVTPVLDQWDMAAWTAGGERLRSEFYDWQILSDGRLALSIGCAEGSSVSASLDSAAFHAALKAHATYPHDTARILMRLNETLWGSSTGGLFASLFYALLDPETGMLEYSFAGRMHAWVSNHRGVRPLTCAAPFLGVGPETPYVPRQGRILADESLVVCSQGLLSPNGNPPDGERLNRFLGATRLRQGTADDLVERLRLVACSAALPGTPRDATLLVARRLA